MRGLHWEFLLWAFYLLTGTAGRRLPLRVAGARLLLRQPGPKHVLLAGDRYRVVAVEASQSDAVSVRMGPVSFFLRTLRKFKKVGMSSVALGTRRNSLFAAQIPVNPAPTLHGDDCPASPGPPEFWGAGLEPRDLFSASFVPLPHAPCEPAAW